MFYSILALLIFEPYASSKHSGVLAYFNRRFIEDGILPKELGEAVNIAFCQAIFSFRQFLAREFPYGNFILLIGASRPFLIFPCRVASVLV